jgi:hypothetical protein
VYERGTGRSPSANVKEGLVPFLLEDGFCLSVSQALDKDYKFTGLIRRDEPALPDARQTVTVRFEVNRTTIVCNTLMFIGCAVVGVSAPRLHGE